VPHERLLVMTQVSDSVFQLRFASVSDPGEDIVIVQVCDSKF
jgi:hypothetical protein